MTEQERMARPLAEVDPEVYRAVREEMMRQNSRLELIASENFTSEAVLEATGSVLHEQVCGRLSRQALLRRLRVRGHGRESGARPRQEAVPRRIRQRAAALRVAGQQAAYVAVLQPGDTILGMNLAHGGHLTHGHPLNFSGQDLQDRAVRRAARRRNDRLRRTGEAWPASTSRR